MNSFFHKIKVAINKHKIISFDIFDTLLVRPYMQPNDLFTHIEETCGVPGFRVQREQAFNTAITSYCDENVQEVTLNQIYEFMPEGLRYLKEYELSLEMQVLKANPEIKAAYDYALRRRKVVVIVSDMYLPRDFIENVLHQNGYTSYKKLYVSSSYGKLKFTKDLYKIMLDDMGVPAQEILHIGDNEIFDYQKANDVGICAFKYIKISEQLLLANRSAMLFYESHHDLSASILLAQWAFFRKNDSRHSYWFRLGFLYGGAFIYAFMSWLLTELRQDDMREVFFVARDGYTLKKVLDMFAGGGIRSYYLYAPRILAVVCTLDIQSKIEAGSFEGDNAIKTVVRFFADEVKECGLVPPDLHDDTACREFYKEHIDLYKKLAGKKLDDYRKYFASLGSEQKRIALVDTMTTFFTAQNLVCKTLENFFVRGYYNSVSLAYNVDRAQFSYNCMGNRIYNIPLLELLITSPESPITNIIDGKAIYKQGNRFERYRSKIYPEISRGEICFCQTVHELFGQYAVRFNYETVNDCIDIFTKNPSLQDIRKLRRIKHSWGIDHSDYEPIFAYWTKRTAAKAFLWELKSRLKRHPVLFRRVKMYYGLLTRKNRKVKL